MYVVDASVVVKWFLPEAHAKTAEGLLRAFLAQELELIAPDVVVAEVGSVFRKRTLTKEITAAQAHQSYQYFLSLEIPLHASSTLAPTALRLAIQENHPVYDTFYVALAQRRGCELVTADKKLVTKMSQRYPFVRLLGEL